jgi:hypothetical protein
LIKAARRGGRTPDKARYEDIGDDHDRKEGEQAEDDQQQHAAAGFSIPIHVTTPGRKAGQYLPR